jgi:hypothetical protein
LAVAGAYNYTLRSVEKKLMLYLGTLSTVSQDYLLENTPEFPELDFATRDVSLVSLTEPKRSTEEVVYAESSVDLTKKRQYGLTDGFGVFRATLSKVAETSPDAAGAHRSKRLRTSEKERPPCLRCRILKKKVRPNQ